MFRPDTRFLIIDDSNVMRTLIQKTLEEFGFKNIETAEDGLPALDILSHSKQQGRPIEIVICDWKMPDMNGLQLLKNLRQSQDLPHALFILITAETEKNTVVEAVQAGANGYLFKPFSAQSIELCLKRLWLQRQAEGDACDTDDSQEEQD